MRRFILALACILAGCWAPSAMGPAESPESGSGWTWPDWSAALLRGVVPTDLPPIPVSGWRYNGVSWVRHGAEIADHNSDGHVDYIRIVDPPYSYRHPTWIDQEYDGYFDSYPGSIETGSPNPQFKVPLFELANKAIQTDAASRRR